jgi:hypothetical protein
MKKTPSKETMARRGRKALDSAPDWFGCGRNITQESWSGFVAAMKAHKKSDSTPK